VTSSWFFLSTLNYFQLISRNANISDYTCKGKSITLQAWTGLQGSRKLRFPDYVTTAQDGGNVLSIMHRQPLPPRKYSWNSFLLEAESAPGPQCPGIIYVYEKYTDTSWDRTSELPICSRAT